MKKVLLLILVVVATINVNSQNNFVDFRANYFMVTDGVNVSEDNSNVKIRVYTNTNRIVIYSNKQQIIDYSADRQYRDEDNYSVVEASATDTNYKNILLKLLLSPNGEQLIVIISYQNIFYMYSSVIIR